MPSGFLFVKGAIKAGRRQPKIAGSMGVNYIFEVDGAVRGWGGTGSESATSIRLKVESVIFSACLRALPERNHSSLAPDASAAALHLRSSLRMIAASASGATYSAVAPCA